LTWSRDFLDPARTLDKALQRSPLVIVRLIVPCFLTILVFGCAGVKPMPQPIVASIGEAQEVFHRNQILDLASGKSISFSELLDRLSSYDLIFVGETHTNPEHHLIQVQILQALLLQTPSLAVGMEFFQQDQQAVLDRYILEHGKEEAFLEEVDWKGTWGYPYHFYRPLLLEAKQQGVRVVALNAPRDLVRKVAREGLDGLEEAERAMLPRELDLDNEAHRDYVRRIYERHDHETLPDFEFFYEAQCVWDETMARNIARFMATHDGKMVVFSGNGHIVWKFGIPDRTQRRIPVSLVTLVPYGLRETVALESDMADYVWLTAP